MEYHLPLLQTRQACLHDDGKIPYQDGSDCLVCRAYVCVCVYGMGIAKRAMESKPFATTTHRHHPPMRRCAAARCGRCGRELALAVPADPL